MEWESGIAHGPTKPNQQLRRDLKQAAALLKWSGVDLLKVCLEDEFKERMTIAVSLQEHEDKLAGSAEEVTGGQIMRLKLGNS